MVQYSQRNIQALNTSPIRSQRPSSPGSNSRCLQIRTPFLDSAELSVYYIEDIDLAKEAKKLADIHLTEHFPVSLFFVGKTQQYYELIRIKSNSA